MAKQTYVNLDRKIDILRLEQALGLKGNPTTESYGPFAMGVWAAKEDKTGRETDEAGRETATGTTLFTIRYRGDLLKTMRIRCEGTEYEIEAIAEQGRRQFEVITARTHN